MNLSQARVVIADHQPLVLEGLAHVLTGCAIGSIERCGSGRELLDTVLSAPLDLAIADVRLDDPDGLTVLREVRQRGLQTPFIFTTGHLRDSDVLEGIRLGIRGLIARDATLDTVADCVRTVLAGGTSLDQALVGRAMAALLTREASLRELAQLLTAREIQVLQLVVTGIRTREIAGRLYVSEGTLKVHLHHIYEKLQISSRDELMAYARDRALI